jgi:DNA modification methylase
MGPDVEEVAFRMTVFLADPDVTLHHGDALELLRTMPAESVHCCVTSPPFYGLRDYGTGRWEGGDAECDHDAYQRKRNSEAQPGTPGSGSSLGTLRDGPPPNVCAKCGARRVDEQIGLEATPEAWVTRLVEVFREVRRVLRRDGTLWLEVGDSYNGSPGGVSHTGILKTQAHHSYSERQAGRVPKGKATGTKPKDLIGAPWLLAFALRADGWYLRSDIVWSRPNPMPESVTDRPTKSHSYVFLLAKSPRYFFDQEAVREPPSPYTIPKRASLGSSNPKHEGVEGVKPSFTHGYNLNRPRGPQDEMLSNEFEPPGPRGPDGRRQTKRISNSPENLHENHLSSLGRERWPNENGRNVRSVWTIPTQPYPEAHFATFPEELARRCILAGSPEDGVILDPFVGSGTVPYVARKHGRRAIGIDLSADYLKLAAERLAQQSLFAHV